MTDYALTLNSNNLINETFIVVVQVKLLSCKYADSTPYSSLECNNRLVYVRSKMSSVCNSVCLS